MSKITFSVSKYRKLALFVHFVPKKSQNIDFEAFWTSLNWFFVQTNPGVWARSVHYYYVIECQNHQKIMTILRLKIWIVSQKISTRNSPSRIVCWGNFCILLKQYKEQIGFADVHGVEISDVDPLEEILPQHAGDFTSEKMPIFFTSDIYIYIHVQKIVKWSGNGQN